MGFFAAHRSCCQPAAAGGFQSCWYLPGSVSSLTKTNVVLTGLGWHRKGSKGAFRTQYQSSMEEITF